MYHFFILGYSVYTYQHRAIHGLIAVWATLMRSMQLYYSRNWAHSDFDVGFLISQFLSKAFRYGSDSMFRGTVEMDIGSIDNTMPWQATK